MDNQISKNKLCINIMLFVYLSFISVTILNDYITYIYGQASTLGTYNLALTICAGIFVWLKQKGIISFKKIEFHKFDIIVFLILFLTFIIRFAIPENSFDTLNYHLILQQNPFSDYINYHFFPGRNLNTFSYPLGDRMFFIFREVLGYRLGILLNYLVVAVIYYLLKDFISMLIPRTHQKYYNILISAIAFLGIASEKIYEIVSIYYIDILFIPLLIELTKIVLFDNDLTNINSRCIYFGLLSGMIIAFKITNIIFVFILLILYLFKIFKGFNLKHFLTMIVFAIIPWLVYTINIYVQTGNPVFPFYNSIFKSQFFSYSNWLDDRFGPKNVFEIILWPFIIFLSPNRTADLAVYSGKLSISFLICIIGILLYKIKSNIFKINKPNRNFILLFLVLTLFWSITMIGYIRYGLILEVFSGVIMGLFLYFLLSIKEKSYYLKIGSVITCLVILLNISLVFKEVFLKDAVGAWRIPFYKNLELHKRNIKYVFIDRFTGVNAKKLNNIEAWGICDFNSGYAMLLNPNIPNISLNSSVSNDLTASMLDRRLMQYKNLYTIIEGDRIKDAFDRLNGTKYVIGNNIIKIKPYFIDQNKSLYLFNIIPAVEANEKNSIINLNSDNSEYNMDLSKYATKKIEFKALIGLNPIAESWGSDGFNVDFYITTYSLKKSKVYSADIKSDAEFNEISFNIDLSEYPESVKALKITFSNNADKNGNADWVGIINPKINLAK